MNSDRVKPDVYILGAMNNSNRLLFFRLFVFALACSYASYLIGYEHKYSPVAKASSPLPVYANHLWIWVQGFLLTTPGLTVGYLLVRAEVKAGVWLGRCLMLLTLVIQLLDLLAYTYYRDRLFSEMSAKVLFELSPSLALNLNTELVWNIVSQTMLAVILCLVAWKLSDFVATQTQRFNRLTSIRRTLVVTLGVICIGTAHPLLNWTETVAWMKRSSDRHPLASLGLLGETEPQAKPPTPRESLLGSLTLMALEPELRERELRYSSSSVSSTPNDLPDILLIIVESLRHEAISPKTSPNLYALANQGIWAKNHFSSANSTNMAMFSIFYSLESIWSERRRYDEPALIRTARQCGYRTGFFGAANDWSMFHMDGFVSPENFDVFEISEVGWTAADARMCQLVEDFLESDQEENEESQGTTSETPTNRQPRLAVLYLYSTHFDYQHDELDRIHEPALALDVRLTAGYSASEKELVWNRYLNSVHCIDRLVGPLLDPNRLICFVGDHGESFLEDNYRVHGTNISKYQNMTPCIIAGPGINKSTLTCLTSHADVVPTLFDACGIQMTADPCWEGHSMRHMPLHFSRAIATRDYIKSELAVVTDEYLKDPETLGYRAAFSLAEWQFSPHGAVSESGKLSPTVASLEELHTSPSFAPFSQWMRQRFATYGCMAQFSEVVQLKRHLQSPDPQLVQQAEEIAAYLSTPEANQLQSLLHSDSALDGQPANERISSLENPTEADLRR